MKQLLFVLLPILFLACPQYGYKYNSGSIPDTPVNLTEINSEYDDFNLSAPWILDEVPLVFSSNRLSQGGQMDFVYKLMAFEFSKENGEFQVYEQNNNNLDVTIRHNSIPFLLNKVNTAANEYGPYIMSYWYEIMNVIPGYEYEEGSDDDFLMLYANDANGNLDIFYHHNRISDQQPAPLESINSTANEAYPCFNSDYSRLYFCSDEAGNYDLFQVNWENSKYLEESLTESEVKSREAVSILNSEAEDKCPYLDENILVFTSDRPGGYGGFDLYYSTWEDGSWSEPINFGEKINSSFDEYRPIIRRQNEFTNDLLMFSSNRPGGKGGYDLYYCGVIFDFKL